MTEDEYSQYSAAIHEAGHAVIASNFGLKGSAFIRYRNGSWSGVFLSKKIEDDSESSRRIGAIIAISGILSQTKWQLEVVNNCTLKYSDANPLDKWLSFLSSDEKDVHDDATPVCMIENITEVAISSTLDRKNYSESDRKSFLKWSTKYANAESFYALVRDVFRIIDGHDKWESIKYVADEIVRSDPDHEGDKGIDWNLVDEIVHGNAP